MAAVFGGSLLVYSGAAWTLSKRGMSHVFLGGFLAGWVVALTVALALGWQGATWNMWTAFAKTVILGGVFATPVAIAAAIGRFTSFSRLSTRLWVGVVIGGWVSLFMPLLGLMAVCGTTGDCL